MRYIIGIDLGTTNSCVSYIDTASSALSIQPFKIPQLIAPGHTDPQATLPSFCYLTSAQEWPQGSLQLPWKNDPAYIVGRFARDQGSRIPTRLVQSAKSWLCHAAANRREKILPIESTENERKISPVEASAHFLRHIREAWNHSIAKGDPEAEFELQEVILTVPASFDEAARMLTAEAAKMAGFTHLTLLEEPQAAFYSWLSYHEHALQQNLHEGACILVCDVGGGTTDFSLIDVQDFAQKLSFQRMSVGDHLLLGGDNMDAAIAHYAESKLRALGMGELTAAQWLQLKHEARMAKESLLGSPGIAPLEEFRIVLQGTGSSVVQGSFSLVLKKEEAISLLVDGFFGQYSWEEAHKLRKATGLRTMGLPYEDDPSITRHLAHFLASSGGKGETPKKPDFILFNGGAMKPPVCQKALLDSLTRWFPEKTCRVLSSHNLDLAVARGAAYYGKARRGLGVKIGGGSARNYYLVLEKRQPDGTVGHEAITLLTRGAEEGESYEPETVFWLTPNTPVSFTLLTSHVRLHDHKGEFVPIDALEMHPLPPIHTVLRYGKKSSNETPEKIPVHLGISLTPIGTIEMWLQSQKTEHKWVLEFQLKSSSGQDDALQSLGSARLGEIYDEELLKDTQRLLENFFEGRQAIRPEKIMEALENKLGLPRREWSMNILRALWDPLLKVEMRRKSSPELEARWWNLAGFFLRPGFGYPLDDFRMKEFWKIALADSKKSISPECEVQRWICFRRAAGGLTKGQQLQLAADLSAGILPKRGSKIDSKGKSELYRYSERVRAFAALELIEMPSKIKAGNAVLQRIVCGEGSEADYWALGRIGARHLLYGTLVNVVPKETCQAWIEALLQAKKIDRAQLLFLLGQLARKTTHREVNLPEKVLEQIMGYCNETREQEELHRVLFETSKFSKSEEERIFGDKLPAGLSLE
jgi:hypothetical protein